jgi:hypothetical protein
MLQYRHKYSIQGVTRRCRLSLLTKSALIYRVQIRGGGGDCGVSGSANEYSCAHQVTWTDNFQGLYKVHLFLCYLIYQLLFPSVKFFLILNTSTETLLQNVLCPVCPAFTWIQKCAKSYLSQASFRYEFFRITGRFSTSVSRSESPLWDHWRQTMKEFFRASKKFHGNKRELCLWLFKPKGIKIWKSISAPIIATSSFAKMHPCRFFLLEHITTGHTCGQIWV